MDDEIRNERPIGYLVHDVARLFRRRFEVEARHHGLTLAQWRTLVEIYKQDAITQVALAASIDADPMTMSGILDRLEKRGLLERYTHPDDSRAKFARLTEAGDAVVKMAKDVGRELYANAITGLSEAEKEGVVNALTLIRNNLNNLDQVADTEKEAS
ncbi:MarR family transcriptional regulator [Devosia sp. 2618]|uniref:MarR family winged helix-turn-helix transcriptional regulator n=1 Tax=Devosia sp. 2618 TaxID=3156454 RepID=UPI003399B975